MCKEEKMFWRSPSEIGGVGARRVFVSVVFVDVNYPLKKMLFPDASGRIEYDSLPLLFLALGWKMDLHSCLWFQL